MGFILMPLQRDLSNCISWSHLRKRNDKVIKIELYIRNGNQLQQIIRMMRMTINTSSSDESLSTPPPPS
jgi:hypothetical protein